MVAKEPAWPLLQLSGAGGPGLLQESPGRTPQQPQNSKTAAKAKTVLQNPRMRALTLMAILLASGDAGALGDREKLMFAQLDYGGSWNPRPSALKRLAWEIEKRTSIETAGDPTPVKLSDESSLRKHPLVFLSGDSALPNFSEEEVARLRRHLSAGGLLVVDGAEAHPGGAFDQSVRSLVKRIFPKDRLDKISPEHVLYKSFYLLRTPVGRLAALPYLEGVEHDGRLVIVYSQNDLAGAWARDNFGQWEHEVVPGGMQQREMAFRLGVNLAMYALCLDYKTDQVHVPFILRRRQWQAK
jgi:uncharacterized protein DUF4159